MADTNSPDLVGNTGVNDPWSVWGASLLQSAESLGSSALNTALTNQTPVKAPSSSAPGQSGAPAASSAASTKWVFIGVIVAIVAGAAWFVLRRGK